MSTPAIKESLNSKSFRVGMVCGMWNKINPNKPEWKRLAEYNDEDSVKGYEVGYNDPTWARSALDDYAENQEWS